MKVNLETSMLLTKEYNTGDTALDLGLENHYKEAGWNRKFLMPSLGDPCIMVKILIESHRRIRHS